MLLFPIMGLTQFLVGCYEFYGMMYSWVYGMLWFLMSKRCPAVIVLRCYEFYIVIWGSMNPDSLLY